MNRKVRFGIVGTGTIAHRFAQAIGNVSNAELVAVASRTKENAEKFGNEFDVPVRFESYEEMAKSDVLDAALAASFSSEKDTPDLAQIYAAGGKDAETISVNEYSSMVNKIVF